MVIEITRKCLMKMSVMLFALVVLVLFSYFLYTYGYNRGYDAGVTVTTNKYEKQKGNGNNFFAEEVNEQRGSFNGMTVNHQYMIYHSTPNCKAIKNGVAMDRAYTDSTYRMSNSKFCPKCMDKMLIQKCERFLQNDFDN